MSTIQQTTVTKERVKLIVADGAVLIEISVAMENDATQPIAATQLVALRAARNVIDAEMKAIEDLRGRKG